jgi:iron complex transport system substrate-binding protein
MRRHTITTLFLVLYACTGILAHTSYCKGEPVIKDIPYTVSHSKAYRGVNEEPTQAYSIVRRGAQRGDNEDRQMKATPYLRIISLGPAITEALYLLGVEDRIIGVTTYCQKPAAAVKKEKIGTIMEINMEKVINLKPDLVIATGLTNSKDIKKLKNLGINVVTFDISKDFDRLCQIFLDLGKLLGKEEQARTMIAESKKRIVKTQKKVEKLPRQKVFVQLGSKPLFAVTRDYFINDLIEFAGGINIFKDAKSGLINREEVVRRNPDIVIITTMGIAGEKEQKSWQQYRTINAVKNKQIFLVDSDKICSPTPVSFADFLEEIVKILHPEAFNPYFPLEKVTVSGCPRQTRPLHSSGDLRSPSASELLLTQKTGLPCLTTVCPGQPDTVTNNISGFKG